MCYTNKTESDSAKALLDVLEGQMDIKSVKGEGSTFTISIPRLKVVNTDPFGGDDGGMFFDTDDDVDLF